MSKPNSLQKLAITGIVAMSGFIFAIPQEAKAATMNMGSFTATTPTISVSGIFTLFAHEGGVATNENNALPVGTPLNLSGSVSDTDRHGTTGEGSITGTWDGNILNWTLIADVNPGVNPDDPPRDVSFQTMATFISGIQVQQAQVVELGVESLPEPSIIFGLLAVGSLGLGLKRKKTP